LLERIISPIASPNIVLVKLQVSRRDLSESMPLLQRGPRNPRRWRVLLWEGKHRSIFRTNTETNTISTLTSAIITLCVGPEQRLFAAHEDVLSLSPFFSAALRGQFLESHAKRINLPEEIPEIFSSVLEYLYKGDYYPRLLHNKRRNTWELEDAADNNGGRGAVESTVYHQATGEPLLKDTML